MHGHNHFQLMYDNDNNNNNNNNNNNTYVVKGLLPSKSARYTKSVELHYKSGKMKTRRFLLLRVSC